MAKKLLIAAGVMVALVLSALFMIPVFYDVNTHLRPKIVRAIEENLNAKAEIGRLSLSLWGKVRIEISSLAVTETASNTKVFEVEGAELRIPFMSLLSGRMDVTFAAEKPKINLIVGKDGKVNALKMLKPAAATADSAEGAPEQAGSTSVAGLGGRLFLSTDIEDGMIAYKDLRTGMVSSLTGFGLELTDVGLNHPFKIAGRANLDVKGQGMSLGGPVELKGVSEIRMGDAGFERLSLDADSDLSAISITVGSLFRKTPKNALTLSLSMVANPESVELKKADLVVNDLKVNTTGTVRLAPALDLNLKITTNELALEQWKNIIAMIGDYNLKGRASFALAVNGGLENLKYAGGLDLKNGSADVPGLRLPATDMNLNMDIRTDKLLITKAGMKFGKSDLALSGTIEKFSAPRIRMSVTSALLNLDEMLPESKPGATEAPATAGDGAPAEDISFEGPVATIKKNPVMRKMDFVGQAKIARMIMRKAEMTDFNSEVEFKSLVLNLKSATLKAFGGAGEATLLCDFNAKSPAYKINGNVNGVDINAAVTSQFPDLKDTVKGQAWSKMAITGEGAKLSEVKRNLRGNGDFRIEKGSWSALAGMKMLAEKLSSNPQVRDKIGGVAIEDRFRTAKAGFSIKESKLFIEKAELDMEGSRSTVFMSGWINFEKMLDLKGEVHAPLANPPPDLRAADGRAKLPFEAEGPMTGPNFKWDATVKAVANAYLKDEGAKLVTKELQKLKENVKDDNVKKLLENVDEKAVNDLLKGLKF